MTSLLLPAGETLLLALLFHALPQLTRPDLLFGVTVPPHLARSELARAIVRRYRVVLWLGAAVALSIAMLGRPRAQFTAFGPLMVLPAALLAFVGAHRRATRHAVAPSQRREASLAPRSSRLPGGWLVQLGPFVLIGLAAARVRPALPRAQLAVAALVCALLALLAQALQRTSRRVVTRGAAGAAEHDFKRLNLVVLIMVEYWVALAPVLSALPNAGRAACWPALGGLALTIAITVALVRLGQGGTRRAAPDAQPDGPIADRTRDAQWKWGLLYVNRDDPALLVEKRFGLGYTLNFGNPRSWVLVALIGGIVVASAVLVAHSGRR